MFLPHDHYVLYYVSACLSLLVSLHELKNTFSTISLVQCMALCIGWCHTIKGKYNWDLTAFINNDTNQNNYYYIIIIPL